MPTLFAYGFKGDYAMDLNTRFVVEMLQRGFLGFRQFKPSLAHTDKELNKYATAVTEVFSLLSRLPEEKIAISKVAHTGFKHLTKE